MALLDSALIRLLTIPTLAEEICGEIDIHNIWASGKSPPRLIALCLKEDGWCHYCTEEGMRSSSIWFEETINDTPPCASFMIPIDLVDLPLQIDTFLLTPSDMKGQKEWTWKKL
ncbi:hypothetical protein DL98DRAFT_595796 [Cadophora sp. DSE1049]|nr:hypothetical protein DL98DRAFT_595796 [Cadophora sp. DSE1049]